MSISVYCHTTMDFTRVVPGSCNIVIVPLKDVAYCIKVFDIKASLLGRHYQS